MRTHPSEDRCRLVGAANEEGLYEIGLFYQLPCAPEQDEVTRYHETIEQIVYADELGFDAAWLAELHFFQSFSIMPAPLILATALPESIKNLG